MSCTDVERRSRVRLTLYGVAWLAMAVTLVADLPGWSAPSYAHIFRLVTPAGWAVWFAAVGLAAMLSLPAAKLRPGWSARWLWVVVAGMSAWWAGSFVLSVLAGPGGPSAAIAWSLLAVLAVLSAAD